MTGQSAIAIDVQGPVEIVRRPAGGAGPVDAGEARHHLWLLGPNGSGKTTTIRMLCGLLTPDSGEGTCLGYDIRRDADKIKRQVGYMTQRFSLYQDLSVRENLEFVARLYGVRDARGTAHEMIKRLGLNGREEQLGGELSGGWKQRLALGRLHSAQSAAPAARRADRRRRSQGTARLLERDPALAAQGLTVLVSTITWTRPNAATRSPTSPMAISSRTHRGRGDREIRAHDLYGDR